MKVISILYSPISEYQASHHAALKQGFEKMGISVESVNIRGAAGAKHVACWGWKAGLDLRSRGKQVLVVERGYLGDRFRYSSLGWNGLNGYAAFPDYPDDGGKRFDKLGIQMNPWKDRGKYILIMGQVPTDASLQGRDLMPWYKEMANRAQELYDFPVVFRPHPAAVAKGYRQTVIGTEVMNGDLSAALDGAALCITWNSNSSVDAVLAGVPTVIGDRGSMAFDMCSQEIADIRKPCRLKWAHSLAWKQWTLEEIKSGLPLQGLVDAVN